MSDETGSADVVVVGGGPAGCSAAVFTARYGLDTLVFDRGSSSIRQCAFLENYLGFPGGVDIETFLTLAHEHVEASGATLVDDLVTAVTPVESEEGGFHVATADGHTVHAERVVAASTYDDSYLPFDALPTTTHDGDPALDRDHPGERGRTDCEGLYVAGPLAGVESQVAVSVGHGARVGLAVVADARRDTGYWDAAAERFDWVVEQGRYEGDDWVEYIVEYYTDEAPDGMDDTVVDELAHAVAADQQGWQVTDEEIERRTAAGHRALAEALDPDAMLDALDDDRIRQYAATLDGPRAD